MNKEKPPALPVGASTRSGYRSFFFGEEFLVFNTQGGQRAQLGAEQRASLAAGKEPAAVR